MSDTGPMRAPGPVGVHPLVLALAGLGLFNGLFSPLNGFFFHWLILLAPAFLISSANVFSFLVMLVTAASSIVISGIPVALYHRFVFVRASETHLLAVWVGLIALLSAPTVNLLLAIASDL